MSNGLTRQRAASVSVKPKTLTSAKAKATPKRRVVAGLDDRVPPLLYTVDEAAQALHISVTKMWNLVRRGEEHGGVYSRKIDGLRRVPVWALEAYTRPQLGKWAPGS